MVPARANPFAKHRTCRSWFFHPCVLLLWGDRLASDSVNWPAGLRCLEPLRGRTDYPDVTMAGAGTVWLVFAIALAVLAGMLVGGEFSRHWLIRSVVRVVMRVYCRQTTSGREHVPLRGPLIIASNHGSWLDTLFLGAAIPRLIHFMAARQYYDLWYLKWVMWMFGTIPIDRGKGQREPFRRAIIALEQGRVIGIFPEGRMTMNGEFQRLEGGMALLAEETGALILPVAILGNSNVMGPMMKIPRPRKVRVRIGPPIDPQGLNRDEILARLDAAIRRLLSGASE